MTLETQLSEISGFQTRFISKLDKMGIKTVHDLLWHFPIRYEDLTKISSIQEIVPDTVATIQGEIIKIDGHRAWKRRKLYIIEAIIRDETGIVSAVWFNQPYIKNILQVGTNINISGKVSMKKGKLVFSSPTYELAKNKRNETTLHTGRIVGVYPETRGLTSKGIRYLIKPLFDTVLLPEDPLPPFIREKESLPSLAKALHSIHFPETLDEALSAKQRFAFEDLFFLQLFQINEKIKQLQENAFEIHPDVERIKKYLSALPFNLTNAQKKALWEICQDLAQPHPMNRLLQGDVGAGKTIVAALASLEISHHGLQSIFMAPTEILAQQHFQTFKKFFSSFENGIALLTNSQSRIFFGQELESELKKDALKQEINNGRVSIIIGTHALLQKDLELSKLALVVIDEQHRFGVRQRAHLIKDKKTFPHFLSMSATPIPRTLSLTIFGDLDLSLVNELPKERKKIITKIVTPINREKAYTFIREEVKKGRQCFVVCPRIEPTIDDKQLTTDEIFKLDMKNVKEEFEKLSKKVFSDLKVSMLHGKLKPQEKEKIMHDFKDGKSDILVATSVVEVGVDVPNATIMMIESAERFGLAQLYQFRGRVGRGEHQSYCFLLTDSSFKSVHTRLQSIVTAKNGLELAEKDLKLRGPGEFLGNSQTGIPDLAMKAIQNPDFVIHAREYAKEILKQDPQLSNYPVLQKRLQEFTSVLHRE